MDLIKWRHRWVSGVDESLQRGKVLLTRNGTNDPEAAFVYATPAATLHTGEPQIYLKPWSDCLGVAIGLLYTVRSSSQKNHDNKNQDRSSNAIWEPC